MGIKVIDLRAMLDSLPARMKAKRHNSPSETRLLYMGVRTAAKQIGISPTTYCKAEACTLPQSVHTIIKILEWLEQTTGED